MEEITANVNWLAVLIGAALAFVLGALWYSPMLFGKKWAEGNGLDLGTAKTMPLMAMAMQVVGLVLIAWFVGVTAVESKALTFVLAVLAFGFFNVSSALFVKKTAYVIWTDFGYLIAVSVIMFAVQGIL